MLYLKDGCCFICMNESPDKHIWIGNGRAHKVELHTSCWKSCSGTGVIKKYYNHQEWIDLAGERYSSKYICLETYINSKHWFKYDKLHRLDGPAIDYFNGSKQWIVDGLYHRLDGPAIEYSTGARHYYIRNREYFSVMDYDNAVEELKYLIK